MGFRYTRIKSTRKYFRRKRRIGGAFSVEAIPEHELCTLKARGKSGQKNKNPPPQSI